MIALIDADELVYRACFAQQREIDWNDDGESTVVISEFQEAYKTAVQMIQHWVDGARCERPVLCFSPKDRANFRKEVYPAYKGKRSTEKPEHYWQLVDELQKNYKFKCEPELEADDLLGLYATHPKVDAVVCSQDKDVNTLPVRWYDPKIGRTKRITPMGADYFWMMQTLTGDQSDGYPGCPKVGPVKAEAALKGATGLLALWERVVAEYRKRKLSDTDALVQARCSRILRHGDYNFETKQVRLWKP